MTYIKIEIRWNEKRKCYIIESFHKNGEWQGSTMGAKIYPVSNVFVHTEFGSGIPIAVYKDIDDMKKQLFGLYKCEVIMIEKNNNTQVR